MLHSYSLEPTLRSSCASRRDERVKRTRLAMIKESAGRQARWSHHVRSILIFLTLCLVIAPLAAIEASADVPPPPPPPAFPTPPSNPGAAPPPASAPPGQAPAPAPSTRGGTTIIVPAQPAPGVQLPPVNGGRAPAATASAVANPGVVATPASQPETTRVEERHDMPLWLVMLATASVLGNLGIAGVYLSRRLRHGEMAEEEA